MNEIIEMSASLCREFEGFSATPYLCPSGVWTIGYGTVIKYKNGRVVNSKNMITAPHITMDEVKAEKLLKGYLRATLPIVQKLIDPYLSPNQWAALLDFSYNLGTGNLQASTLRKVINRHDYADVPRQLRRWVFAGGQRLRGLQRRRETEILLWEDE